MIDLAIAVAVVAVPLSPTERAAVIATVKAELKDPESAQFKGVQRQDPEKADGYYCGWVNAKNSFGGFTGFSVFYVSPKGSSITPPELSEPELCR